MKVCGGSECVLFEKCGPDFEPIFWPRFRGRKMGSVAKLKEQHAGGPDSEPIFWPRFCAHFYSKSWGAAVFF